jgi:tRNA (guanine9-N1)-methyltransferase
MSDLDERPHKKAKIQDTGVSDDILPELQNPSQDEITNPTNDPSENGQADVDAAIQLQLQSENTAGMSKSQLKKLRKKEQWEAGKEYRKVKRREKHKEKQSRKAEERAELQAKIAAGEIVIQPLTVDEEKKKRPSRPIQTPVSLVLDCDFDELMTDKELISLGAQLTRCYSDNRCSPYRSHIAISSWGGKLQSRFETVLTNNHLGWKGVRFFSDDFEAASKELDGVMRSKEGGKLAGAFSSHAMASMKTEDSTTSTSSVPGPENEENDGATSKSEPTNDANAIRPQDAQINPVNSPNQTPSIIYLSSDSPHTLEKLSPYTSYIIGGIVDKNRHKGLCYKRACERGIPTAKLPIGEYMTMQSRSVLAINHVVEIMLKWLETGDWGEAFLSVIPKRKEAKLKSKKGEERKDNQAGEKDVGGEEESEDDEEGGTPLSGPWDGDRGDNE